MKNIIFLVITSLALVVSSCDKDDPQPASQKQSRLLAGNSSQSKQWRLTTVAVKEDSNPEKPLNLNPCFRDNIYTFENNPLQDYVIKEGSTKCNVNDPDTTEKGSWAFTQDGKTFIIAASLVYSNNASFGAIRGEVLELTDISFKISVTQQGAGTASVYTYHFNKL